MPERHVSPSLPPCLPALMVLGEHQWHPPAPHCSTAGVVRWWCSDVTSCLNPYGAGCYHATFIFLKSKRTGSFLQYNVISDDWAQEKGRHLYFYGTVTKQSGHDWCKTWWVSCCLFNDYSSSPNSLRPTDVPSGYTQPSCINWLKSDTFESFIWWFSGSNQWERIVMQLTPYSAQLDQVTIK